MNTHLIPPGEEDLHDKKATCKCNTTVTVNSKGEIVVVHFSFKEGVKFK